MAEERLYRAEIRAVHQEVCCKKMAECVWSYLSADARGNSIPSNKPFYLAYAQALRVFFLCTSKKCLFHIRTLVLIFLERRFRPPREKDKADFPALPADGKLLAL